MSMQEAGRVLSIDDGEDRRNRVESDSESRQERRRLRRPTQFAIHGRAARHVRTAHQPYTGKTYRVVVEGIAGRGR